MRLTRCLPFLLLLGCSDSLGPGSIFLSLIETTDEQSPPVFTVPSTTQIGVPFRVDLATFQPLLTDRTRSRALRLHLRLIPPIWRTPARATGSWYLCRGI